MLKKERGYHYIYSGKQKHIETKYEATFSH